MDSPELLQHKIINFLIALPNLDDTNSRQAFIYGVGLDPQLQDHIPFDEPRAQFVPLLVSLLINYGKLSDGRYALEAVLKEAKKYIGQDKQKECESLLQELQTLELGHKKRYVEVTRSPLRKEIFISIAIFILIAVISLLTSVVFQWPIDFGSHKNGMMDTPSTSPIPPTPRPVENPRLTSWAAYKTHFNAKVELNALARDEWFKQNFMLLLVCQKKVLSIPESSNRDIQKSELYPIGQRTTEDMAVEFNEDFTKSLNSGDMVSCRLCLLNKKYSDEGFTTLSELYEKKGYVFAEYAETIKD